MDITLHPVVHTRVIATEKLFHGSPRHLITITSGGIEDGLFRELRTLPTSQIVWVALDLQWLASVDWHRRDKFFDVLVSHDFPLSYIDATSYTHFLLSKTDVKKQGLFSALRPPLMLERLLTTSRKVF